MAPVTVETAVWVLTALAALVVVLTRIRLSAQTAQSGAIPVPQKVVNSHTLVGILALVVWIGYLRMVGGPVNLIVGALGLLLWWIEVVIGLLILARWKSGRGRHATAVRGDGWTQGPWLSVLAHGGLLLGVAFFTVALFIL